MYSRSKPVFFPSQKSRWLGVDSALILALLKLEPEKPKNPLNLALVIRVIVGEQEMDVDSVASSCLDVESHLDVGEYQLYLWESAVDLALSNIAIRLNAEIICNAKRLDWRARTLKPL